MRSGGADLCRLLYEAEAVDACLHSAYDVSGRVLADEYVDGWKRAPRLTCVMIMEKSFRKKFLMYALTVLLLAGYLYVLYVSFHPQVTADYRMRYIEEGYFYGENAE